MIHWLWILPAVIFSTFIGIIGMAVVRSGATTDKIDLLNACIVAYNLLKLLYPQFYKGKWANETLQTLHEALYHAGYDIKLRVGE